MGSPLLLGAGTFAPVGPTCPDTDADNFITAAGITDNTQKTAICTLCTNLKAAGLWTKMTALYPIVGGSASSHAVNLKTPGTYNLTFATGWTHSSTGMTPLNTYANTSLNTSIIGLNSGHYSFYSRTNNTIQSSDIGNALNSPQSYTYLYTYIAGALRDYRYADGGSIARASGISSTTGMFITSRTASNIIKGFRNGVVEINSNAGSSATSTVNFYLGCYNNNGTPEAYSNRQNAFASIGEGLTDLEAQVFNQIVEGYQFALGRNINPSQTFYYNPAYNNETNAFLYSTQITDVTTQGAVNTLVSDMKTYGVWSKMKAVYPVVGGTAATHKFNLVNPEDTNAAKRLTFTSGWTHTSSGMSGNAVGYAVPYINPATELGGYNAHLSVYVQNNTDSGGDIGASNSSYTQECHIISRLGNLIYSDMYDLDSANTNAFIKVGNSDSRGFTQNSVTSNTSHKVYKNGVLLDSRTGTNTTSPPSGDIIIGAIHVIGSTFTLYSNHIYSFISLGNGLTDTESANFRYAVEKFQTTLGRGLTTNFPTVSDTDAQSFINSANITDVTQANAVNDLVLGLKADGLWTKMRAIYPVVGGTASSHAVNLKTPGTFNLTFATGMTHSSNGMVSNGTSGYANTSFNPSVQLTQNSASYGLYSRTNRANSDDKQHGVINGSIYTLLLIRNLFNNIQNFLNSSTSTAIANSDSRGFFQMSRTTSTNTFHSRNNSVTTVSLTSNGNPNGNVFFCCRNLNGTPNSFDDVQISFAYCGEGLTDTEMSNFYTRVQNFQTTLGRQV